MPEDRAVAARRPQQQPHHVQRQRDADAEPAEPPGACCVSPTGPLANLQKIRDTHVDQLNALFKQIGQRLAQRNILDQYALSQTEARSLSQQLLGDLATIKGTTRTDLNIAAAVLFKMNVSPVAVGSYSFGGDNHSDNGLAGRVRADRRQHRRRSPTSTRASRPTACRTR